MILLGFVICQFPNKQIENPQQMEGFPSVNSLRDWVS